MTEPTKVVPTEDEIAVVDPTPVIHDRPAIRPSLQGPLEPNPADIVLVSHPDTMDGMAAAWVIYKVARRDNIPVEFVNIRAEVNWTPSPKDILNRNWIAICDDTPVISTYGKGLLTVARQPRVKSPFAPIPYRNWKRVLPFGIDQMSTVGKVCGIHDPKKSLCMLAWEFFCADRAGFDKPPRLITHIDDHTTGTWKYNDSKNIAAIVSTYPHDLPTYDKLAKACEDRRRREDMVSAGFGIARYLDSIRQK